jgi:glycosyltransferase involved in cell wall biosynthesis
MIERILYSSLIDVSLPSGPGVNERLFLREMMDRLGNQFCAVIPTPSRGIPQALRNLNVRLIPVGRSVRTRTGWLLARTVGVPVLIRELKAFQPDLLVMRVGAFALPYYAVAKRRIAPYALKTAGGVTFEHFYNLHPVARPFSKLNRRVAREIWSGGISIDVVNEDARRRLLAVYPHLEGRVHVVDNGVDITHFRLRDDSRIRSSLGIDPNEMVVGFVGNFPMRRGGKEVVDVVSALRSHYPVKGLIVGDTGEAESCREYVRQSDAEADIIVYGEADYADVPTLMSCVDIGLSILRPRERTNAELKVRQYLASGACVVGTVGSNDFLRGHSFAQIVESEEPQHVILAVESLLAQGKAALSRWGAEARLFAERTLSMAARNSERIRIWENALRYTTAVQHRHSVAP